MKRGDVTKTKNFLSSPKDRFRVPYGRNPQDFPRQNVFAGMTDETNYLVDTTGNRRFWPVRTGFIDISAVTRDRDQLWAEAFDRYARCERWYVDTAELRKLFEEQQAERVQGDPWDQVVSAWLADPRERKRDDTTVPSGAPVDISRGVLTRDVLWHAIGKPTDRITRSDEMRVADALRVLGYERGPMRREDGIRVRRYHVVTVVTEGGDTLSPSNDLPKVQLSLLSLPNTCTQGAIEGSNNAGTIEVDDPHGDSGDSDAETPFADWVQAVIEGQK